MRGPCWKRRWGQNYHGDGDKVSVAGNIGLPLTEQGFANLSFEFLHGDETSTQRAAR